MLDVWTELISAFWITLEVISIMLLFETFFQRKANGWGLILGGATIALLTVLLSNRGYSDAVKVPCCVCAYAVVMSRLYNGKFLSCLLIAILGYTFLALFDVFFINGFCALVGVPFQELIWMKRLYVGLGSIGKLLTILFCWTIHFGRAKRNMLGGMRGMWLVLILVFPVTSLIMLYMLYTSANTMGDVSFGIVIAAAALTAANIAIIYIITALEKAVKQEQDLSLLKQQMNLQADQLKSMELNYRSQRRITHEFERHLQTMQGLLQRQEYGTVEDYICKLQRDRSLRIVSVDSHHPVIDAILNQIHQLAQESGIQMQIEVNDLSTVSIQTDKLVVLLANLLDNALEACLRLEGSGEIRCRIVKEECLYVAIRNTSVPVEIKEGRILSSKSGHAQHGYGLQAVRYVMAELNGEYTFDYSDGWFRFVAEIPIH